MHLRGFIRSVFVDPYLLRAEENDDWRSNIFQSEFLQDFALTSAYQIEATWLPRCLEGSGFDYTSNNEPSAWLPVDQDYSNTVVQFPAPEEVSHGASQGEENEISIVFVPNDPRYTAGGLWGMYGDATTPTNQFGSQAAEAWAQGYTGSTSNIIGVIDIGIDYTHPDLYLNIWLNQREIPVSLRRALTDIDSDGLITFRDLNGSANATYVIDYNGNGRIDAGDLLNDLRWANGIDDDSNGYLDDLIGWDFANNDNDPLDDNNHGTHVAGTIGALGGNGIGVVGVNWDIQMMPLKFLSASGSGATTGAIRAVNYFTDAAINASAGENFLATSNSWGGSSFNPALLEAITRAAQHDILFIASAGNSSSNNDVAPRFPSGYSTAPVTGYEAVVSVASINSFGDLSSFSNYGSNSVDIAAPGSSIWSTIRGGGYGAFSGTSMATPHVAGAIALYASLFPHATGAQIREALFTSVTVTPSVNDRVATDGRLDISEMLAMAPPATAFADWLEGGPDRDTLEGGGGEDVLNGYAGSDFLLGGAGRDILFGDAEADTLDGGTGADTLYGGDGSDVFILADSLDLIIETAGGGADTIITSVGMTMPDQVEVMRIAADATGITITGGAGNDMLIGNGLANSFNGGAGDDVILAGNVTLADIYALFAT